MQNFIALTLISKNKKVGRVPVSTSSKKTCPDICPLKEAGCYAKGGPLQLFWQKVTEQKAGLSFFQFLQSVAALPVNQFWRHNQAGDLEPQADKPELIDAEALADLVAANKGRKGFTYCHYNAEHPENRHALSSANKGGFTVNLSGNNFDHADKLAAFNVGPVVTIAPLEYQRLTKKSPTGKTWAETLQEYKSRIGALGLSTKAGRQIVICPATYVDQVSCNTCRICQVSNRKTIVAFPAHGQARRKADAVAMAGGFS